MVDRLERYSTDYVRQHILCMTMNHTVDAGETLEDLPVDEALAVALLGVGVDGARVADVILD